MGKADERTDQIKLKSALLILCVIVLCDVIFPKEYMWQIFFLYKYSFAFLASAIYLAVRYKKDFFLIVALLRGDEVKQRQTRHGSIAQMNNSGTLKILIENKMGNHRSLNIRRVLGEKNTLFKYVK